jgi:hypothetical protein
MSSRGLLVATALLLILGGGVWWSNRHQAAEEAKPKPDTTTKVVAIPEDQVTQISLKREGGGETVLKRDANNKWEMVQPQALPVDQEAASGIAGALASLSAEEIVDESAANLAPFGLDTPSLELAVMKKDGSTEKVLIGDEAPTGGNVYAKNAAEAKVFTIASHTKSNLDKSVADLRDKRLLTFDSDKLTRVELTARKQSVEFGKNNQNEWQIVRPSPMRADGYQVEELIRKLRDARMDLSNEEDARKAQAAFASGSVVGVAKVTDASGTQTIEVRKVKDDYYARSTIGGPYKLSGDLGAGLDKNVDEFRNKKLFDFGFSDPSKVEVRREGALTTYAKSADRWFAGPKQIDSTSLQNFVDKLRDLSAASFVASGFGTPMFEVTVTSNEGKRVEKVLVSKTGNDYFAKRDNEPAIYKLDNEAAEEMIKAAAEIKEAEQPQTEKK